MTVEDLVYPPMLTLSYIHTLMLVATGCGWGCLILCGSAADATARGWGGVSFLVNIP